MHERPSLLSPLSATDSRERVERLASQGGEAVRDGLGRLMSGLDRRARLALDPVRRHRRPLAVVGLGSLALVAVGGIGLALRKRRREPGAVEKARRLGRAVARMIP